MNSPVRAYRHVWGEPVILARSRGPWVWDAQGRRLLDVIQGWGALPLGHNPPEVVRALRARIKAGVLLGLTHEAEAELARLIVEAVPSVEQVRFAVSGTEACMTAVRLARACTARDILLTFEGCYHGHGDGVLAGSSGGIPQAFARDLVRIPYNDVEVLERTWARHGGRVACAIIEPVAANMGVVPPRPGFLQRLRDLTRRHGALLIFDEVVTGFRLGLGGAQGTFGITPDLTVFGKIIGGGLPIGAVGGPRRLMQRLAPEGDVYHAGTFAGHPLSMAAGVATLRALREAPPYEALDRGAARVADGIEEAARRAGVPVVVNRAGSMLTVFFSDAPVRNLAGAQASHRDVFARWAHALHEGGVLIPPSPCEAWFLSTAHTGAHLERLVRATKRAFAHVAAKPPCFANASQRLLRSAPREEEPRRQGRGEAERA